MDKRLVEQLLAIKRTMELLIKDYSIPKNIRNNIELAKERLENPSVEQVSSAIYLLDEASTDINMPLHGKTDLWELISELERIKEWLKDVKK